MITTADAVNDLRDALARRQLAVIVGSGVTAAATQGAPTATWRGLVIDGIDRCESLGRRDHAWAARAREDVNSQYDFDLIVAAEKATDGLGGRTGPDYRRWLTDSIGTLQATDASVLHAVAALGKAGALLVTTNYDGLLSEELEWEPVTWRDSARLQSILRGREDGVVHLHGYWRDPESVVFGASSYADILSTPGVAAFLKTTVYARTLLFVGFGAGLHDPNFSALRKWMRTDLGDSEIRHYRLVRDSEIGSIVHAPEEGIVPVSYGPDRSDLAPFLTALSSGVDGVGLRGIGVGITTSPTGGERDADIDIRVPAATTPQIDSLRRAWENLAEIVNLVDDSNEEAAAVMAGGGERLEEYRRFVYVFAEELAQVSLAAAEAPRLDSEEIASMSHWAARLLDILQEVE